MAAAAAAAAEKPKMTLEERSELLLKDLANSHFYKKLLQCMEEVVESAKEKEAEDCVLKKLKRIQAAIRQREESCNESATLAHRLMLEGNELVGEKDRIVSKLHAEQQHRRELEARNERLQQMIRQKTTSPAHRTSATSPTTSSPPNSPERKSLDNSFSAENSAADEELLKGHTRNRNINSQTLESDALRHLSDSELHNLVREVLDTHTESLGESGVEHLQEVLASLSEEEQKREEVDALCRDLRLKKDDLVQRKSELYEEQHLVKVEAESLESELEHSQKHLKSIEEESRKKGLCIAFPRIWRSKSSKHDNKATAKLAPSKSSQTQKESPSLAATHKKSRTNSTGEQHSPAEEMTKLKQQCQLLESKNKELSEKKRSLTEQLDRQTQRWKTTEDLLVEAKEKIEEQSTQIQNLEEENTQLTADLKMKEDLLILNADKSRRLLKENENLKERLRNLEAEAHRIN